MAMVTIVYVMTDGNTCTLTLDQMISTVNMNVTNNICTTKLLITVLVTMDTTTLLILNHTLVLITVNLTVEITLKKMVKDIVSVQMHQPILKNTILVQISHVMSVVTEIMKQLMMVTLVNVKTTPSIQLILILVGMIVLKKICTNKTNIIVLIVKALVVLNSGVMTNVTSITGLILVMKLTNVMSKDVTHVPINIPIKIILL
jgi:hypothetical protein